jgi:hypothetical protein
LEHLAQTVAAFELRFVSTFGTPIRGKITTRFTALDAASQTRQDTSDVSANTARSPDIVEVVRRLQGGGPLTMDDASGLAEALLGLDGFRVLSVQETTSEMIVTVETRLEKQRRSSDEGLCRIGNDTRLAFSFLRHCGLKL